MSNDVASTSRTSRSISIPAFLGIVVVYVVMIQGLGLLTTIGLAADYGEFPDIETLLRGNLIPVGTSLVFVMVVISVLGWWQPVLHDDQPVQRWVWFVPALMLLSILVVTDYANLSDLGAGFTATMLVGSLCIGAGEELMFRGIGVTVFRVNNFSEHRVALWSSIVFGGVHITNIITEGPSSILQVVVVSFSGVFLYLTRRVSGGIVLPVIVHALWDFSLFSTSAGEDPEFYPLAMVAMLCNIILVVVLWVRRDRIEPEDSSNTKAASA